MGANNKQQGISSSNKSKEKEREGERAKQVKRGQNAQWLARNVARGELEREKERRQTGVVQIFVAAMRAMHAQAFPLVAATHLTTSSSSSSRE